MFWGLIMEPNKRYTQTVEKSFHVSMAALDVASADDDVVQVTLCYDGTNYLLCSLKKGIVWQVPLDLHFQEGNKIAFTCNGQSRVHLTGYLLPDDDVDLDEDLEEEEEEEEEVPSRKQSKRKAQAASQGSKKIKRTKQKVESSDDQDLDETDDEDLTEYETLLNDLQTCRSSEEEVSDNDDEDDDDNDEDDDDDDDNDDDDDDDDEEEEEEEKEEEEAEEIVQKKSSKQQGKKNKQVQQQQQQQSKKKDKQKLVNGKDAKQDQQKKRVVEGGVLIKDLKNGNGAPAKAGKFISVYFVGRLQNGKKFDSTMQGDGFKFRLGKGEVIKGWDVGIAGMKVGGKRQITIPPAMAYGAKGFPPTIPGNSTLVFDVELKNVH